MRRRNEQTLSRVERATARVRRWALESRLLEEFHLTLPPETYPLDDDRRSDHVRWRRDAQRELGRARRARWLRRALTFGLWRQ